VRRSENKYWRERCVAAWDNSQKIVEYKWRCLARYGRRFSCHRRWMGVTGTAQTAVSSEPSCSGRWATFTQLSTRSESGPLCNRRFPRRLFMGLGRRTRLWGTGKHHSSPIARIGSNV